MTTAQPTLGGLDAIPWKTLRHARGEASDIPIRLRALLDPTSRTLEQDLPALEDALCRHGAQISEASLAAVPFLLDLIACTDLLRRERLLDLLVCISRGEPRPHDRAEPATNGPAADGRPVDGEQTLPARINTAIAARQTEIAALLEDPDPDIASAAFALVECLPSREPILRTALHQCLTHTHRSEIRAAAAAAIAASDDPQGIRRLRERLVEETDPLPRVTAIIGLLLHRETLDRPSMELVFDLIAGRFPELLADYNRLPCSLGGAAVFAIVAEHFPQTARARIDTLIDTCAQAPFLADYEAAGLLYLATAAQADRFPPGEQLTPIQRRAIETVACATWDQRPFEQIADQRPVARLQQVLRAFGLPDSIDGLRRRLGYPARPSAEEPH